MTRMHACVIGSILLLSAGAVHGTWTGRWGGAADRSAAAERLGTVPLKIGAWEGEEHEMSDRERDVAGIDGYLLRRYTYRPSGESVSVMLVCGRAGPVAVHTPDVCYGGAGYGLTADPAAIGIPLANTQQPAAFRTALFRKEAAAPDHLRIFWTWHNGVGWTAPDRPRWALARARFLYKLYVVNRSAVASQSAEEDVAVRFLRVLLPELQKSLFE